MFLLSWFLGIGSEYLIALGLVVGGAYLALFMGLRPLRIVGGFLIVGGLILGSYTYGKQSGGAVVTAEWQKKNYEARIAELQKELTIKKEAADLAAQQASDIASQNIDLQKQVSAYEEVSKKLNIARIATPDDDKRVCDIIGNSAVGCKHPK